MENYKAELTSLKEELTSRIDAVIAKIEKPNLVSGWYVDKSQKGWIANFDFETNKVYGIDTTGNWFVNNIDELDINDFNKGVNTKATPTEVQEALTKEAVKRGFKEGVRFECLDEWTNDNLSKWENRNFKFLFSGGKLWISGINFYDLCIFKGGIWATPIKTKTIDEIATSIKDFHFSTSGSLEQNLIKYFSKVENKQTIIETLNNL